MAVEVEIRKASSSFNLLYPQIINRKAENQLLDVRGREQCSDVTPV